jgi:hypothetical protein
MPLGFFSFSKVYIWDFGMRFAQFLLGSCNPNLNQTDEFSVYIFPTMKSLILTRPKLTVYNGQNCCQFVNLYLNLVYLGKLLW